MTRFTFLLALTCLFAACQDKGMSKTETSPPRPSATPTENFGGLALYSVRDAMGEDPRGTLRKVAAMGYTSVEAAGYDDGRFYGMAPAEFKAYLKEVGLRPVSTHMGMATTENAARLAADAKAAGFEYFVIPVPPMGAFAYDAATKRMSMSQPVATVMANVNAIAAAVDAAGLKCLYHNHDFEFRADGSGVVPIEYFLANSDPKTLNFQMDLFWVTKAGADPVAYFDKYPGRWKAWHVKDMDAEGRFAPVGTGSIDFKRILAAERKAGVEFYLVEQDQTFGGQTPLEAVALSHGNLGGIGFK